MTMTMTFKLLQFLTTAACLVFTVHSLHIEEREVEVTGNIYAKTSTDRISATNCSAPCVADMQSLFDPMKTISELKETQVDTIESITHIEIGDFLVPVYSFHQPKRISSHELPFQLILMRSIDSPHHISEASSPKIARDSWFLGYYWSIAIVCDCRTNTHQQIGWKFTSINNEDSFYALIVNIHDLSKKAATVRVFGKAAEGWMLTNLIGVNSNNTVENGAQASM